MMRRRFLKLAAAAAAVLAGVGAIVVKLLNGGDAEVLSDTVIQISGDFGGTIPTGTTGHIVGDVNLTGDLIVEGVLTGIDTFTLTGNGFQVLVQSGGVANLAGQVKSGWVRWGETVTGWVTGDRLAVSPTAVGVFLPTVVTWQGSWAATSRPANAADVTLVDGSVAKPEVANLTRTITMTGLRRFHLHDGAGVQSLRHFAIVNSGTTGVLADYPLHFHLCGDTVRGSSVEGVVVEGGKNHAFVPHGSHGITQTDCVAYNTIGNPYWWDKPPEGDFDNTVNDTEDILWDHCLALGASGSPAVGEQTRLTGFFLGAGQNMTCTNSVASCIAGTLSGGKETSGFHWPENADRSIWDFHHCVAHNNGNSGIFVWQNGSVHIIEDFVAYRNGYAGVNHGAYSNVYRYSRMVLSGNHDAVIQHAKSVQDRPPLIFEDIESDSPLTVTKHNSASTAPTFFRRCHFPQVRYGKLATPNPRTNNESTGTNGSHNIFEDCGLTPVNFDLAGIKASSIIEIVEGGVLMHRWQSGVWS